MNLFNAYGMSETAGAHFHHNTDKFKLYIAGCCLPGAEMKIDKPDEKGEGEILMKGRDIMMGYLNNSQATKEAISTDGFLHSGDRGHIDKDGFLSITGRIKELIITAGGENVAPVIIEDNFKLLCPPCSNVMVVGDYQRFLGALVSFKTSPLPTGQPSRNLLPEVTTTTEAIKNTQIIALVEQAITKTNQKSVSRAAHIRKFRLIEDDFSFGGGELTPTMKLKRKVTEKKFKSEIDELFVFQAKL